MAAVRSTAGFSQGGAARWHGWHYEACISAAALSRGRDTHLRDVHPNTQTAAVLALFGKLDKVSSSDKGASGDAAAGLTPAIKSVRAM